MSSPTGTPPSLPPRKSGIVSALEYTGIPASWLSKRPKLPSRNWLIFLGVTSSITGAYVYDRQQCKRIRQHYIDKVKHLAEEIPGDHFAVPRKVTVLGTRWPGDEDYDVCLKYFRKYVKPILVAAAVDYEVISGKRNGDLAQHIADLVKSRRRLDAGLDPQPSAADFPPNYPFRAPEEQRRHELAGGIVIVGRPAWKEFMAGLTRGWTEGLEEVDREEVLAQELASDGRFDEGEEGDPGEVKRGVEVPGPAFGGIQNIYKAPSVPPSTPSPSTSNTPTSPSPSTSPSSTPSSTTPLPPIPPLPPLLFVPFINYLGFTQIPIMIFDFFNHRHRVREGAQAAYRLVMGATRPFEPPFSSSTSSTDSSTSSTDSTSALESSRDPATPAAESTVTAPQGGDLDFDLARERWYRSSLSSIPADVEAKRSAYYSSLPAKLQLARELARGIREATKEEAAHPPKTEVELRSERMAKEKRWRGDVEGWEVVRPGRGVEWDARFAGGDGAGDERKGGGEGVLRVFVDPEEE